MSVPVAGRAVLFVCMGNICRSPTAEAVMLAHVAGRGLGDRIVVDSAGTTAYHAGEPADRRMREHARARGYELASVSRQVRADDFRDFDLIVAMDSRNLRDLRRGWPEAQARELALLSAFLPPGWPADVPDPYHGGGAGFETVLDMIEAACPAMLDRLVGES